MGIFEFDNYKTYTLEELRKRPKNGRGEFLKIAKSLGIHTTMVTHIFRGDSELSLEHALALADYLGLNEMETDYLVALVQRARAGTTRAREFCEKKIASLRAASANVGKRFQIANKLSETDQAIFYSSWSYAAVRLLTAIPGLDSASAISRALNLPLTQINQVLEFLISRGLVVRTPDDSLQYGDVQTYAGRDSKFAAKHSLNWHLKAIERLESISSTDIAFSNAIVISEEDYLKISERIVQFIAEFQKTAGPSPSEILCCFNIDWIKLADPT